MPYIVLDLEWNQAMSSKASVFNKLPIRLRGPRRRDERDQQHRAQRQRRQYSELFQSRSPLYL